MEGQDVVTAEAVIDNGAHPARTIRFETGRLARQAAGSAVAYLGDTMVLSATTASKNPKDNLDFFPLTVDVEERMYALGKIPGSFFRREGRPSEDAILTCRLIDRPLRPSFAKGLRNEIQIVETIMALDPDTLYDVVAINAASASTQLAGLPFSGPIGATRVAFVEGDWIAFPTHTELARATFDMVVAGRVLDDGDVAIMMVEAEATRGTVELIAGGSPAPTEDVVASGLEAAKPAIRSLCAAQSELAAAAAKPVADYPRFLDYTDDVLEAVTGAVREELAAALTIAGKQEREAETDRVKALAKSKLAGDFEGRDKEISAAFRSLTKTLVRQRVVTDGVRIDGRGLAEIRSLAAEVEVVPRVHGSALFERGETQILGVTTLNMLRMEQMVDTLNPENRKRYMHNYNFPPYSTGETGRVGSPKRREIGHGALAERALLPVLPSREEFPYAIRQVSEALSSNGSTSMGSVCASTLSLLNAGVPLKAPVAGIAMGLIHEGDAYVTLTDILGAEDAFGDMDFKVAGTKDFVTALQLDTKLDGIPASVLASALQQAKAARLAILDVMNEAIDAPDEMSPYAPRVISVKIPVDKIGEVIGPKGKMINQIQADTGADISIEDDGTIYIGATNGPSAEAARTAINSIANPQMPEVGERYLGTVVKTTAFGAFVSLTPGRDGLLHISKLKSLAGGKRVDSVDDVAPVGTKIQVEIGEIDSRGKISLSPVVAEDAAAEPVAAGAPASRAVTDALSTPGGPSDDIRRTVLPGGLRLLTEVVPAVRSVAFGVWVGVGSRDESRASGGASHFLEHLLFKGTARRDALAISSALDEVGGELNAFTTKEYTCYYARVLDDDLPLAVDVVCDMVTSSRLASADVEAERGVILEEIAMHDDDPGDAVHDVFAEAVLGDSPLGRPVLGTVDSIEAISRTTIAGYYRRRYTAPAMVVAAAGNLDHDRVRDLVLAAFEGQAQAPTGDRPRPPAPRAQARPVRSGGTLVVDRPTEQANVVLGAPGLARTDERRFTLSVLSAAFGGGMSSRLFQEVREKRGLAYSVYSFTAGYADTGLFGVYAGCATKRADDVLALCREQLELLARDGLTEPELVRGKGQVTGGLVLGLEDTGARMTRLGKGELLYGEVAATEDILARVAAVTADDVRALARDLVAGPLSLGAVGPFGDRDLSAAVA